MPLLPRHRVQAAAFRARTAGKRFAVYPLDVLAVDRLTDDAVAITFDVPPDLREAYQHRPGQHVVVLHDDGREVIRRSYSICSPAGGALKIAVRELAGGAFSPFATRDLREGETLHVMVPSGSFGLQISGSGHPRQYGMVAAGSGITPILSIAASVLESEPLSRVTLLYGNRTAASTMFRKELSALRDRHGERLAVTHVFSREQDDQAIHGRIRPEFLDVVFALDDIDDWFLCGPEGLMEETAAALAQHGVDADRVHRELFHSDAAVEIDHARRPELTSQVRLRLNGIESVMSLHSRGETILTAALEIRDDLPYACREAICGTCRAKVVAGEVVMDRCSALDRRELESGYVLACQAHPVTAEVTLDFDT